MAFKKLFLIETEGYIIEELHNLLLVLENEDYSFKSVFLISYLLFHV